MSVVLQASDKKFYESPMWLGKHGNLRWLLNYFEMFYLTVEVIDANNSGKDAAPEILQGWPVKIGRGKFIKYGVFPPDWESCLAYRFPITFNGMPPKPTEATPRRWAPMDDFRFCWCVEFPTADVHAYVLGEAKRYNNYLNAFLGESDMLGDVKINRVRLRLRKQFKAMIGMDLNKAIEEFGDHVEVDRLWTSSSKLSQQSA